MKFSFLAVAAMGVAALTMVSCTKEDAPSPTDTKGSFSIHMEYLWAMSGEPFEMNTNLYHPMTGDTLNYSTFKHYISNVTLVKADGSTWSPDESYHLLDVSDPSSLILQFDDVPNGTYTSLTLTLGVDSARNVSGAQTGALDPANGMFWSWNSGYIMIKAEGTSPQSGSGTFGYHLGGFSGEHSAIAVRNLPFPAGESVTVHGDDNPSIWVQANPARIFHTYGTVANGTHIHMPGENAGIMAQDFNSWVRVSAIQ